MKLLVYGSEEITPDYMFITDDKDYYFEDILGELIEDLESQTGEEIKVLTKGSNSGVDAMANLLCGEMGVELDEKKTNKKLVEKDAEIMRDVQLANDCDAGIILYIKYSKFRGTNLDNMCQMLDERGKPVYIFPMEKFS